MVTGTGVATHLSNRVAVAAVTEHAAGRCETAVAEAGPPIQDIIHLVAREGQANKQDVDAVRDRCWALLDARATVGEGAHAEALVHYANYAHETDAIDIGPELAGLYEQITALIDGGAYCDALSSVDMLARSASWADWIERDHWAREYGYSEESAALAAIAESDVFAPVREAAGADHPVVLLGCAGINYVRGNLDEADPLVRTLQTGYPDHELVGGDADVFHEIVAAVTIRDIELARAGQHQDLGSPDEIGDAPAGEVHLELAALGWPDAELLYAGPEAGRVELDSGLMCDIDPVTITLPPGEYEVLVRPLEEGDFRPIYGSWELAGGNRYFGCFHTD